MNVAIALCCDIKTGIDLGTKTRKFFTELRENKINPWETENPISPYYAKSQEFKQPTPPTVYMGAMIGQLGDIKEWYANAKYLFETDWSQKP